MEIKPSKPIDKGSRGEINESPGRIEREHNVASKKSLQKQSPQMTGEVQHEQPNTDG
jgi:hypothetical protein